MLDSKLWKVMPRLPTNEMLEAGFPMRSKENALFDYHQLLKATPEVIFQEDKEVLELLKTALEVVMDFLPNIRTCVLQDYGRLNDLLVAASKLEGRFVKPPTGETSALPS